MVSALTFDYATFDEKDCKPLDGVLRGYDGTNNQPLQTMRNTWPCPIVTCRETYGIER